MKKVYGELKEKSRPPAFTNTAVRKLPTKKQSRVAFKDVELYKKKDADRESQQQAQGEHLENVEPKVPFLSAFVRSTTKLL